MFREPIRTPVKINDTTYERELPNGKVEIGDKDSVDFKPTAKLKRWGEECSLVLSIPTTEKILPTIQGEKILWTGKDYGAEFFQGTDGFKFNIILPKKPKTNVFPLDFQSENLNFYYQPPLTEEYHSGWSDKFQDNIIVTETLARTVKETDGKPNGGISRPENVVGSYAVFHANKSNSIYSSQAEAEKYQGGKAFHWYRPLIYDNVGKKCWGVLNVDPQAGLRTVTIPQEFLNNAVYPVTIDDLFGYDTLGGSDEWGSNTRIGCKFACSAAGTGISISWGNDYTFSSGSVKCCLYDAAGDKVENGETEEETSGNAEDWVVHDFLAAPTLSIADYWLFFWTNSGNPEFKYDTVSGWPYIDTVITYGDWPDGIAVGSPLTGCKFSIYCTYTPSGGGETLYGQAILAGVGSTTILAKKISRGEVLFEGVGNLTAIGNAIVAQVTLYGQALLAGVGNLTVLGKRTLKGTTTLAGVGNLTASAKKILRGTTILAGVGNLTTVGKKVLRGVSVLAGVGTLTAVGKTTKGGKVVLAGVGTLTATGYSKVIRKVISLSVKLHSRALSVALHGRSLITNLHNRSLSVKTRSKP